MKHFRIHSFYIYQKLKIIFFKLLHIQYVFFFIIHRYKNSNLYYVVHMISRRCKRYISQAKELLGHIYHIYLLCTYTHIVEEISF